MKRILFSLTILAATAPVFAADHPFWGIDTSRNMVSPETNLPDNFDPGKYKPNTEEVDMATTKGVKWVVKVGSQAYGNPTVAGGKVFIGTNNESPRDPKIVGDRGILMCLDEATGKFLWQLAVPKLGTGKVSDWEFLGICSPPQIEGDRAYIVNNRCEVMCLDVNGMANGNQGVQDEGQYMAGPNKPAMTPGAQDADIIWRLDMRNEVGVFPHNATSSAVLIDGDRLFVTTSNGQDWSHVTIPNPKAPAMICLDKKTGELIGEEASGVSEHIFHSNWSSPALGHANGKDLVVFGGGNGWAYGYDPTPIDGPDGYKILKELWRYDCIPPNYRMRDGKPIKYTSPDGPSEVIASPVTYKNRAYICIGQDPEHGDGLGYMSCVDITKSGDITQSGKIWGYDKITRTLSTVSIADGLVYAGDFGGHVHCLDAETGQPYWVHDTGSHIWGSTLVADGKVYIGNEDGDFTILQAGKEKKVIAKISFPAPVCSTPIAANGTLYVSTPTHLYAIAK